MNQIRGQPLERRSMTITELRVNDSEKHGYIEGYASVFDSWSEELGGFAPFREKVCKGAFLETIEKDDIKALWNHNPDYVLGRNTAGTLELKEDERGLYVKIKPPKTQWAKDLMTSMKRGDVDAMSFGFAVVLDKWYTEGDTDVRELLKVKLYDVSPVTYPAYTATECDVRTIYGKRQDELATAKAKKAANFEQYAQTFKMEEQS